MARSEMLWSRVTKAERTLVEEAAARRGCSISDVMRDAVLEHARQLVEGARR